ncbi:hypothetical protein Patl1_25042 [Pistacia atlantica]|uniref:Uncharacterized protein n=1 Tax=Pistacia atlantica TaxID=434234 RepID=A0ACC1AYR9_9ROSI|nr:hypothetical protein Patl1_25042 [Pistacia atlantica]
MPVQTMELEPVEPQSLKKLSLKSLKRTLDLFSPVHGQLAPPDPESKKIRTSHKINLEYGGIKSSSQPAHHVNSSSGNQPSGSSNVLALTGPEDSRDPQKAGSQNALVVGPSAQTKGPNNVGLQGKGTMVVSTSGSSERCLVFSFVKLLSTLLLYLNTTWWSFLFAILLTLYCYHMLYIWTLSLVNVGMAVSEVPCVLLLKNYSTSAIIERIPSRWPRPVWHPPWKCYRVISGHLGWVRSIAFNPSNDWFCTGSADRTIKIWDVAKGTLKLTLTGHIEQVRGLAVSNKHTYMFSAGDDKQVKCWDLEQNKVIRSYHGHLSGVYCLGLHPTIDILFTGGRDSVYRVWDIRTKMQIFALSGHENTVCSVFTRPTSRFFIPFMCLKTDFKELA